jgi:hypothetical protein
MEQEIFICIHLVVYADRVRVGNSGEVSLTRRTSDGECHTHWVCAIKREGQLGGVDSGPVLAVTVGFHLDHVHGRRIRRCLHGDGRLEAATILVRRHAEQRGVEREGWRGVRGVRGQ